MKGSLIIVGFFAAGIVCGLMGWLPPLGSDVSFVTLCALLFTVGIRGSIDWDMHSADCLWRPWEGEFAYEGAA